MTEGHPLSVVSMYFGISEDELEWTWKRMCYLIQVKGMRPKQAAARVGREALEQPWRKVIIVGES